MPGLASTVIHHMHNWYPEIPETRTHNLVTNLPIVIADNMSVLSASLRIAQLANNNSKTWRTAERSWRQTSASLLHFPCMSEAWLEQLKSATANEEPHQRLKEAIEDR